MKIALITSTIAPAPGVYALKRANATQRLEDYKGAFEFYCQKLKEKLFDRIVYVDNSGYSLDQLMAIATQAGVRDDCEFMSYVSNVDPDNNRFYLEVNLIEHFLDNSAFLKQCSAVTDCKIWKITGRYIIKNVSKIITNYSDGSFDLCVNCRDYPIRMIDFYLFGFSPDAYRRVISKNIERYKGKTHGELILRKQLDDGDAPGLRVIKRFKIVPRIIGIRGFDEGKYGGLKDNLKYLTRVVANVMAPFIWI